MAEPAGNIGLIHSHCAPKPGKYADTLKEDFIGKFIKISFKGKGEDKRVEHMWVKIDRVDSANDVMVGKLENDPIIALHLQFGDTIRCQPWEVEDVLDG
jgi:uncharacterized protein YegJ (DUF2314 family)